MEKFKAHILVVDDDERIRELVKQYLNDNEYLVTTANNAEDAKEKVDIIKFDIIILDIMMPGQSGLDFTNENKKKLILQLFYLPLKVRLVKESKVLKLVQMIIWLNLLNLKN